VLRFLLGLVAIDAAVVAGFGLIGRGATPAPIAAPVAAVDAGAHHDADAAALGKRLAAVYAGARRRVAKRRVVLAPPRRTGDDVELRVSLARAADGFPPGLYCFHCATQRCLFPEPALAALEAVATAFSPDDLRALAQLAGQGRVQVTFVGGASAGPVVPKGDGQSCDGAVPRVEARVPPAFDQYATDTCGARACELAGSGAGLDLGAGAIDDNQKLACLRALCAGAAAALPTEVPQKVVGELAFEQGGAYRGAEVVVTLRGIGADRRGYADFWNSLTQALAEEK
jgi:hypothetical protein